MLIPAGIIAQIAPAPVWRISLEGSPMLSPLAADGVIYMSGESAPVMAIDAANGKLLWSESNEAQRGIIHTIIKHQDLIIYNDYRDGLYSHIAGSGTPNWVADLRFDDDLYTRPAIADDLVITNTAKNGLVAIDLETGLKKWDYAGEEFAAIPPAVKDGIVYSAVSAWEATNKVVALEAASGKVVWETPLEPRPEGPVAITENNIAFVALNKRPKMDEGDEESFIPRSQLTVLKGYDRANGKELWEVPSGYLWVQGYGETILTLSESGFVAYNAQNGERVWEQSREANFQYQNFFFPTLHDGKLYGFDKEGILWIVDAETGRVVSRTDIGGRCRTAPVISGDYLILVSGRNMFGFLLENFQ